MEKEIILAVIGSGLLTTAINRIFNYLDKRAELPAGSKLALGAHTVPVLVAVDHGAKGNRAALAEAGVEIVELAGVEELLSALAQRGISTHRRKRFATWAFASARATCIRGARRTTSSSSLIASSN